LHLKSFKEALTFIPVVQKHGSYTSEKLDEDESFIYIAMAKLTSGKDKLKLLEKSLKAQKNCIPAIRNMVEIYISNQDIKKALKVLNAFFQHTADLSVYALWVDIIKDEDSKYYKRRLKALLKGRDNTFVGYFIQGKELIRQLKLPEALTFLKKADALHSCKQVDILMATAASSIEGHEQEVKDILVKLEKSETYVFEGHDLLQSYQSWQETYIESSKVQIGKPSKYLSLLTKRSQ
ncbi:MAG: putative membrane-anchored protein, partial [bacterium]